jgi:hypothetical protein
MNNNFATIAQVKPVVSGQFHFALKLRFIGHIFLFALFFNILLVSQGLSYREDSEHYQDDLVFLEKFSKFEKSTFIKKSHVLQVIRTLDGLTHKNENFKDPIQEDSKRVLTLKRAIEKVFELYVGKELDIPIEISSLIISLKQKGIDLSSFHNVAEATGKFFKDFKENKSDAMLSNMKILLSLAGDFDLKADSERIKTEILRSNENRIRKKAGIQSEVRQIMERLTPLFADKKTDLTTLKAKNDIEKIFELYADGDLRSMNEVSFILASLSQRKINLNLFQDAEWAINKVLEDFSKGVYVPSSTIIINMMAFLETLPASDLKSDVNSDDKEKLARKAARKVFAISTERAVKDKASSFLVSLSKRGVDVSDFENVDELAKYVFSDFMSSRDISLSQIADVKSLFINLPGEILNSYWFREETKKTAEKIFSLYVDENMAIGDEVSSILVFLMEKGVSNLDEYRSFGSAIDRVLNKFAEDQSDVPSTTLNVRDFLDKNLINVGDPALEQRVREKLSKIKTEHGTELERQAAARASHDEVVDLKVFPVGAETYQARKPREQVLQEFVDGTADIKLKDVISTLYSYSKPILGNESEYTSNKGEGENFQKMLEINPLSQRAVVKIFETFNKTRYGKMNDDILNSVNDLFHLLTVGKAFSFIRSPEVKKAIEKLFEDPEKYTRYEIPSETALIYVLKSNPNSLTNFKGWKSQTHKADQIISEMDTASEPKDATDVKLWEPKWNSGTKIKYKDDISPTVVQEGEEIDCEKVLQEFNASPEDEQLLQKAIKSLTRLSKFADLGFSRKKFYHEIDGEEQRAIENVIQKYLETDIPPEWFTKDVSTIAAGYAGRISEPLIHQLISKMTADAYGNQVESLAHVLAGSLPYVRMDDDVKKAMFEVYNYSTTTDYLSSLFLKDMKILSPIDRDLFIFEIFYQSHKGLDLSKVWETFNQDPNFKGWWDDELIRRRDVVLYTAFRQPQTPVHQSFWQENLGGEKETANVVWRNLLDQDKDSKNLPLAIKVLRQINNTTLHTGSAEQIQKKFFDLQSAILATGGTFGINYRNATDEEEKIMLQSLRRLSNDLPVNEDIDSEAFKNTVLGVKKTFLKQSSQTLNKDQESMLLNHQLTCATLVLFKIYYRDSRYPLISDFQEYNYEDIFSRIDGILAEPTFKASQSRRLVDKMLEEVYFY